MAQNDHTIVSTKGGSSDEGKPVKAGIFIERRMGREVNGEKITVLFGHQMLVGRDKTCDICIVDDRISRKHAIIRIDNDEVRLSDLGSTNGTTRNDETVTDEIIIENGDIVCLGQSRKFEVRIVHRDGGISSVRLASGNDGFLLVPQEMIIGFADPKSTDVDFKIYDPKILPRHARLEYFTGTTFIVSLDPGKPVVVNSQPVRELEIRNNYLIEIGDTLIRYEKIS